MSRQAVLLVLIFVVGLGSGVLLGMGVSHKATAGTVQAVPATQASHNPRDRMAAELKLTDEQKAAQNKIWDGVGEAMGKFDERRRGIDRDRDEAIAALFSPEQKAAYEKIMEGQAKAKEELNKERDGAVAKAHEEFKALLSDGQRAQYEEMLKNRPGPGRRGGRGPGTASAPATMGK
jgi:Spy/CpxP family protein refolding chaperone